MSSTGILILIILCLLLVFFLYKLFKPYFIKYDTTCVFTGGLGSGKTCNAVKVVNILIRKLRLFKYHIPNFIERRIKRPIKYLVNLLKARNKKEYLQKTWKLRNSTQYNQFNDDFNNRYFVKVDKKTKKIKHKKYCRFIKYRIKPMVYANIPMHYKTHMFSRKREWAKILKPQHIFLLQRLREYSVVFIDEFPQFINQFEWDDPLIQDNGNEFITFFRHYIGGYLICTAQSESDIVVQFRRKFNQAIWCFDFKKHLFGLFYTVKMCDIMLSENITTMSTTLIEENTKIKYGFFPPKGTYDTRCYSVRYDQIFKRDVMAEEEHKKLKTTRILRAKAYISPLDLETTDKQKQKMLDEVNKLERI